ncbi:hypothetical protein BDN71DRAFT_1456884 [Pleurotus eryngii]|uniref:F-box domain-containing protein n=1 Tax=Pleurotus eryngii TaxID=5323 RepID=A0A9P5ZKL1_PLEER|nr:hypothetical protein BDN71DRAFT_1456884 [Pleurotus eryngii]
MAPPTDSLNVTRVCQAWRNVALASNSAQIWSSINLSRSDTRSRLGKRGSKNDMVPMAINCKARKRMEANAPQRWRIAISSSTKLDRMSSEVMYRLTSEERLSKSSEFSTDSVRANLVWEFFGRYFVVILSYGVFGTEIWHRDVLQCWEEQNVLQEA